MKLHVRLPAHPKWVAGSTATLTFHLILAEELKYEEVFLDVFHIFLWCGESVHLVGQRSA
jgi:hypothetical protein